MHRAPEECWHRRHPAPVPVLLLPRHSSFECGLVCRSLPICLPPRIAQVVEALVDMTAGHVGREPLRPTEAELAAEIADPMAVKSREDRLWKLLNRHAPHTPTPLTHPRAPTPTRPARPRTPTPTRRCSFSHASTGWPAPPTPPTLTRAHPVASLSGAHGVACCRVRSPSPPPRALHSRWGRCQPTCTASSAI